MLGKFLGLLDGHLLRMFFELTICGLGNTSDFSAFFLRKTLTFAEPLLSNLFQFAHLPSLLARHIVIQFPL